MLWKSFIVFQTFDMNFTMRPLVSRQWESKIIIFHYQLTINVWFSIEKIIFAGNFFERKNRQTV